MKGNSLAWADHAPKLGPSITLGGKHILGGHIVLRRQPKLLQIVLALRSPRRLAGDRADRPNNGSNRIEKGSD
jgi:hypothetical protein